MASKKTGPRCRTIGGVVYDLHPSERQPPCARRRASSGPSSGASAAPAPAVSDVLLTVEHSPAGDGYDLIASSRSGSAGVAKVLANYATRDEAKSARATVEKTGMPPKPPKPAPPPAGFAGSFKRAAVRVNDHRVLERQEREREHIERERARAAFVEREAEKTTLAAVGRLPKRAKRATPATPALKSTERAILKNVEKYNAAGLLYTADATRPTTSATLHDLARRGVVHEHGHGRFYLPQYASELERLTRNRPAPAPARAPYDRYPDGSGTGPGGRLVRDSERAPAPAPAPPPVAEPSRRISEYDRRRLKRTPLPKSIDPSSAAVGDRVSVFSYAENEPTHGTLIALPSEREKEPTVQFDGMQRFIRWERIFAGWLDQNINWKPWKG
jgi:hypothetical protein